MTQVSARAAAMNVRVRLFAIQRELAGTREVALDLPAGATIEHAWNVLVERYPVLAPGRSSVRFARNGDYADAGTVLAAGDELACIPPVSGGSAEVDGALESEGSPKDAGAPEVEGATRQRVATPRHIVELRSEAFGAQILAELADRLATPADGAVVGFLGRTRETPGTPAPGQEAEARRHAGRSVDSLEYEAHESMALSTLRQIADEAAERFEIGGLAIVHRTGEVALEEVSVAVVAVAPHRDAAFRAARYAIDETKARAPIWKAERFVGGHVWIGEAARHGPDSAPTGD